MPIWPFRRTLQAAEIAPAAGPPSALDEIDESTPHRFRFWLADAADREPALAALAGLAADGELSVEPVSEPDGRVRFEAASTFNVRTAAILRPLNSLERAGIAVRGFEALDLVSDIDDAALAQAVDAWRQFANHGPYRHRLEVLAGPHVIETCLGHEGSAAWRFAASCVAFNTPGSEARTLAAAVQARGWNEASGFVDDADNRATLTTLTGEQFDPPVEALVSLIGQRTYVGERAAALAQSMRAPLPDQVTDALCAAARAGGDVGIYALAALQKAAPTTAVRQAVDEALATSEPNLQATALGILAHHWGEEARPTWKVFLASRSVPMRQAAETELGLHGTVEDLSDAAEHLAKLARTKSSVHLVPPRGAEIVDLLVRHQEDPMARAGLDDLSARWNRLGEDLREWLQQNHPWLDPSRRSDGPVEQEAEPEGPLDWPPPKIEREGDAFVLSFEETDMFESRERFEALAAAHHQVEVIDGDREWTSLRISSADPEALIRELWASAGQSGSGG